MNSTIFDLKFLYAELKDGQIEELGYSVLEYENGNEHNMYRIGDIERDCLSNGEVEMNKQGVSVELDGDYKNSNAYKILHCADWNEKMLVDCLNENNADLMSNIESYLRGKKVVSFILAEIHQGGGSHFDSCVKPIVKRISKDKIEELAEEEIDEYMPRKDADEWSVFGVCIYGHDEITKEFLRGNIYTELRDKRTTKGDLANRWRQFEDIETNEFYVLEIGPHILPKVYHMK